MCGEDAFRGAAAQRHGHDPVSGEKLVPNVMSLTNRTLRCVFAATIILSNAAKSADG